MDQELHYGLVRFLSEGRIPTTISKEIAEEVKKHAKNFTTNDKNQLTTIEGIGQGTHGGRQHPIPRIVIPRHQMKPTLKEVHDHPLSGHQGQDATYQKTAEVFYWPGMWKDIIDYICSCNACQKRERKKGEVPLEPIKKTGRPFYQVGIDVIGPLPLTLSGKRYVVVTVDHFTKWVEAKALETADSQSIAAFFYEDIICHHGVP